MHYRIGPNALAADMFEKMKLAGLELVDVHAPYFPDGFEATIGVDRAFNHELPDHAEVLLPVILVADVIITVRRQRYRSYTNGYYWTSGLLLPSCQPTPNGYRQMSKGEGICALAQYPTVRSLQVASAMYLTDELYLEDSGKLIMHVTGDPWSRYTGYIPLSTGESTGTVREYR